MKEKFIAFCWLILLVSFHANAQKVHVKGNALDYKNQQIEFFTYSDQVTYFETKLFTLEVDENGDFEAEFDLFNTDLVFAHLGVYFAYFIAEPGKSYEIVLPPRNDKTEAEKLNPFFNETPTQIGILNFTPNETNYLIAGFDRKYNQLFSDAMQKNYADEVSIDVDSLIQELDNATPSENEYFKRYKRFRFAYLKHMIGDYKTRRMNTDYFLNHPVYYNEPAYMQLFNKVFDRYFIFFSRTEEGSKLRDDIRKKSLYELKYTLGKNDVLSNDTLKELVILKSLHDEFYDDNYSRSAMLVILDSLYFSTTVADHQLIAQNIREKVTRLIAGFYPPKFELYNMNDSLVSLEDFKGKYLYLNFCKTTSYACIQEFELLRNIKEKFGDKVEIVSICADEDVYSMKRFIQNRKYSWTFLHFGNQPDIIKEYDIRAYPTYFIIGKDGKMAISPAKSPAEEVEMQLFNLLRSKGDI